MGKDFEKSNYNKYGFSRIDLLQSSILQKNSKKAATRLVFFRI